MIVICVWYDKGIVVAINNIYRKLFPSKQAHIGPTLVQLGDLHYVENQHWNNVVLLIGATLAQCWNQSMPNIVPMI